MVAQLGEVPKALNLGMNGITLPLLGLVLALVPLLRPPLHCGLSSLDAPIFQDARSIYSHHLVPVPVALPKCHLLCLWHLVTNQRWAHSVPDGCIHGCVKLHAIEHRFAGPTEVPQPLVHPRGLDAFQRDERHGGQPLLLQEVNAFKATSGGVHHDGLHVLPHGHSDGRLVLFVRDTAQLMDLSLDPWVQLPHLFQRLGAAPVAAGLQLVAAQVRQRSGDLRELLLQTLPLHLPSGRALRQPGCLVP
mmetsp:Transcript_142406/g.248358  ORF Transcript_142406/g.248358 Transcript_142406/m.248358 type:complete len:247 (+) Transcript_142406:3418-4158(+)